MPFLKDLAGNPYWRLFLIIFAMPFFFAFVPFSGRESGATASAADAEDFETLKLTVLNPARSAPEFALKDLRGKEVRLNTFRGKPLMLYFWATW